MWYLNRVLEVDAVSRSAWAQAWGYGPGLERQFMEHGLTSRLFRKVPTVHAGWLDNRPGDRAFRLACAYIDDYVESIRMVAPGGLTESRRLPASGAWPSPDRLGMGTEGTVGIIIESWIGVLKPPKFKVSATLVFDDYYRAAEAARAISQAGLYPKNCRLIDALEARLISRSLN